METTSERPYLELVTPTFQPGFTLVRQPATPAPPHNTPGTQGNYGAYSQRMETYAYKIRQTNDVTTIIALLDQAMTETRALERAHDSRCTAASIERAEMEIQSLKTELEQLRGLVYVDHLTGMLNRGSLNDNFAREAARADRSGKALAVALLDIDDFKTLNDQHGHQAGDEALVHLARIIRQAMRPSDIVIRYGGDEFLFLLPDTNPEQAVQALHRVQHGLDRQPLPHAHQKLTLTFSAGVAIGDCGERNCTALIERADAALYSAKRAGKRQVCKAADIAQRCQL